MSRTPGSASVLVLVGSLRAASVNRQLAELAVDAAPENVCLVRFERLGELPHYNEDIDVDPAPEPVGALRSVARTAAALLVITPEYNGSMPGVLKNAIDWLSRPYGNSPMKGKPAAVIGASLGQYGGRWAHEDTAKSLGIAGLRVRDDVVLSVPTKTLGGRHPREHPELVETVARIVQRVGLEVVPHQG